MTRRQSISRWSVIAGIIALQVGSFSVVHSQTDAGASDRRILRSRIAAVGVQQTLIRARAAETARNFAVAYAEFREALKLAPANGPQHEEALRGFAESGMDLAGQRLAEGKQTEAQNIAREILKERPNYQPALALLGNHRMRGLTTVEPGGGSSPPEHRAFARKKDDSAEETITGPRAPETSAPSSTPDLEFSASGRESPMPFPHARSPAPAAETRSMAAAPTTRVKQPLIKVYFATDRLPSGASGPSKYFGAEWNKADDHLLTGFVTVSIPPVHTEGKVERPFKLFTFERSEDPRKHFVLTELKVAKGDEFYSALRDEYDRREPQERSAFVFIHGFNVTFDEAAYRTAQLAYDLDFEGVPIMYSWPSQGGLLAYDADLETVNDFSSQNFQHFLERIAHETGALRINLIAHSMGNVLLVNSLRAIAQQSDIQPLFENVIMAAPDVNAQSFTLVWPEVKRAAKRFTLYASSDDQALVASKREKSGFARLGEAGSNIVVIEGLDTIDASGIDTSLLGHSYVDSCKPVMADLQSIIQKNLAPLERKLRDRYKKGLAYWAFP